MQVFARRVLPLVAIAAVAIGAACEPVKKHPLKDTAPGQNIAYYFVVDGFDPTDATPLSQSPSPFTNAPVCGAMAVAAGGPGSHAVYAQSGQASQTLNADGSVTLSVVFPDGSTCTQGVSGFAVLAGPLGDLTTSTVGTTPASSPVATHLAFDVDGDGKFDPGGTGTGYGADVLCSLSRVTQASATTLGSDTIDETTDLECVDEAGLTSTIYKLPDLKAGETGLGIPGITESTPVAILAWMNSGTDRTRAAATEDDANATVNSLTINGVEKL